jgi:predicted Zn-dependent peptidase
VCCNRFPIGKTDQVKAWEHAVVQHFWSKWYFPGNVTLYIVGDLDRSNEEVIRLIEASFGGFPAGVLSCIYYVGCYHGWGCQVLVCAVHFGGHVI